MDQNRYLSNITQTNGCRVWTNPLNPAFKSKLEIFVSNVPVHLSENDILPHFERFGPVYQFRLMVDYGNNNRGFGYLLYFYDKSALECLDYMGYFLITPGQMLDVVRSAERSHLLALNVPPNLPDEEIEQGFHSLYTQVSRVIVRRDVKQNGKDKISKCVAILAFPDHDTALNAKRWSGVGSVNLWSRNIKILWALKEQIEDLITTDEEAKHVLIQNVPEDFDPEELGKMMCTLVLPREIITIRPMENAKNWMVEFASTAAAFMIYKRFRGQLVKNSVLSTEWVGNDRLKTIASFADFDFELRCFCIANYWDPPIFIYGQIIPHAYTQLCSVIIKNNRNNWVTTFLIEMNYEHLVCIHSRVCELLVLVLMELKELPKRNIVFKCVDNFASIVGAIFDMSNPELIPSSLMLHEPTLLFLEEIYTLSKMSHDLIKMQISEDIYKEYKLILKEKDPQHQFMCGIFIDGNVLGCIDPSYRRGKPLKFLMDPRSMIFVICHVNHLSNIDFTIMPKRYRIKVNEHKHGLSFKIDNVEMIPVASVQRQDLHFTYRPFIKFNRFDNFVPLQQNNPTYFDGASTSGQQQNPFCFLDLKNSLPM